MRVGRPGAIHAVNKNREKNQRQLQEARAASAGTSNRPSSQQNNSQIHSARSSNVADNEMSASAEVRPQSQGQVSRTSEQNLTEGSRRLDSIGNGTSSSVREEKFHDETINLKTQTVDKLVFRKFPWSVWVCGTIFLGFAVGLTVHAIWGDRFGRFWPHHEDPEHDHTPKWWRWLVIGLIYFLSMSFFWAGRTTTVTLDKFLNVVETRESNLCCRRKVKFAEFSEITGVTSFKKGHEGINNYSLHYTIRVEFKHQPPMTIITSASKAKIIKQMYLIRNFVGIFTLEENVQIIDRSTRI